MCLGRLRCSWDAARASAAARVDKTVSSLVAGRYLFPLCSFACTAVALSMWI